MFMNEKRFYEIMRCAKVAASEAAESEYEKLNFLCPKDITHARYLISVDGRKQIVRAMKEFGDRKKDGLIYEDVILYKHKNKYFVEIPYSCKHRSEANINKAAAEAIVYVLKIIDSSTKYVKQDGGN